jgi:hypothetical protein
MCHYWSSTESIDAQGVWVVLDLPMEPIGANGSGKVVAKLTFQMRVFGMPSIEVKLSLMSGRLHPSQRNAAAACAASIQALSYLMLVGCVPPYGTQIFATIFRMKLFSRILVDFRLLPGSFSL